MEDQKANWCYAGERKPAAVGLLSEATGKPMVTCRVPQDSLGRMKERAGQLVTLSRLHHLKHNNSRHRNPEHAHGGQYKSAVCISELESRVPGLALTRTRRDARTSRLREECR